MINLQEDVTEKGIWRYWRYLPPIKEKFRLSLGEGMTTAEEKEEIIFKREDFNPTGSLKDRGLAYQVSGAFSRGEESLVISSSGNAAISAAAYCQLAKIKLFTFVSDKINIGKLEKIKELGGETKMTKRPVSEAIRFAKEKGFKNLRPSVDPGGVEGYQTLAFEIFKDFGKIDDVFIPVSSATCLVGMAKGFKILGLFPRIHACQSTKIFSIAGEFDKDFLKTATSLAGALVAKVTPRKKEAVGIIKQSGGSGWVIGDGEIRTAMEWQGKQGLVTSEEGALALAGIWKARKRGWRLGKTICLLTGRYWKK